MWTSLPLFVITNVTWPDGTVVWESWNAYSTMFTVTVVLALPIGPVGVVVVVVGVVVDGVDDGGGATAFVATAKTPFMPAAAWPGIVHRYG